MSETPVRKPWLGEHWKKNGLLIMGESHYWNEDPEDPEITRIVLADVVSGRRRHKFYTCVERVVSGCASGQTDPAQFWPTVAFANFCPGATPDRDVRATPEMIERGVRAFPAMLTELKPQRILFVTQRCWDATERFEGVTWTKTETFTHDEHKQEAGFFGVEGLEPGAFSMNIHHPAAFGWSPDRWHPVVKDFLAWPL